jgi:hypothetical protein
LGCTIIRETFNTWTPVYLRDYLGYGVSDAARMSSIFPGVGAVSVVASGWLSDRIGVNGRSLVLLLGLAATAAALLLLMSMRSSTAGSPLPLVAIGIIAFMGPYSYLSALRSISGQASFGSLVGIIDGIGLPACGGGRRQRRRPSVSFGWQGVFARSLGKRSGGCGRGLFVLLGSRARAGGTYHEHRHSQSVHANAYPLTLQWADGRTVSSPPSGCATTNRTAQPPASGWSYCGFQCRDSLRLAARGAVHVQGERASYRNVRR